VRDPAGIERSDWLTPAGVGVGATLTARVKVVVA